MMNKLFMIVVSVCCLLMTACGTENDETPQGFRIVDTDVDLVAVERWKWFCRLPEN